MRVLGFTGRVLKSLFVIGGLVPLYAACRAAGEERGARWLRAYLQAAGGTFVKLGQIFASRSDVFGPVYQRELEKLTDRMPPTPMAKVRRIVEAELGMPLEAAFSDFSPRPVASASIAQVHLAHLPEGVRVAVKVMHPGIEAIMTADLFLLARVARLLDGLNVITGISVESVLLEVGRLLRREFDFVLEALNAQRMHDVMNGDEIDHVAPKVYFSRSARRVLTMEFFEGIWLNEMMAAMRGDRPDLRERMRNMNISPQHTAEMLFRSLLVQIASHRTVHADPHGGNVVVLEGGTLGFVDFGNVGLLDERRWRQQVAVFRGLAERNVEQAYLALLKMVEPVPLNRRDRLEREVKGHIADWLLAVGQREAPAALKSNGRLLLNCANAFRASGLPIPWILLGVMRATLISDMYIYALDPAFDPLFVMNGYFEEEKRRRRAALLADPIEPLENLAASALTGIDALRVLGEWVQTELPRYGHLYTDAISNFERFWDRLLRYTVRLGWLFVLASLCLKIAGPLLGLAVTAKGAVGLLLSADWLTLLAIVAGNSALTGLRRTLVNPADVLR